MAIQSDDFKWFVGNQGDLYKLYPNKYLLIMNKEVLATADNIADALEIASSKGLEPGTYIIQLCGEDEWAYTQVFHSRVSFA